MYINKVYIRPEYQKNINPLKGELNIINSKSWNIIDMVEKSSFNSDGMFSYIHNEYTIECDGFVLTNIKEEYLMSIEEARENKLKQIISSLI